MIGFVFPGQGSQQIGMGADLFLSYDLAKKYYDFAETLLGFDLKKFSFEGSENELKQTYVTQPALFVHSVVLDALLRERGIRPGIVAGHSLGEYSAVVAAGALTFEEALPLVKLRGELMQHAGEKQPGTMAAIIGLSEEAVHEVCEAASSQGVVVPANFNSPGQVVISGSVEGIHRAMELARQKGAKRVVELAVSGAFHSPLMRIAVDELEKALQIADFHKPEIPLVPNVSAQATTDPEEIRSNLLQQLTLPVQWVESVREMISKGVTRFFEVGSGRVLTGLIKRIDRRIPCMPVGTVQDMENLSI